MKMRIGIIFLMVGILFSSNIVNAVQIKEEIDEYEQLLKDYERQAEESYNRFYKIIFKPEEKISGGKKNYYTNLSNLEYIGGSTIFQPPFSSSHSWGDKTPGVDEYSVGCNRHSGAVGSYTNAWVGGATSEAMQRLDFYVGRTKKLDIDIEIIRTGGKASFGFGAFSGTEKTWSWDNYIDNYHRSDVDPWWNWDIIVTKIIELVALIVGATPQNIMQAIVLCNSIFDFESLLTDLQDMLSNDDADLLHIDFSFTADPGYHKIWAGLRSTSSACITGSACAVTMGVVSKIRIDGISAPLTPTINGPSSGEIDKECEFCIQSIDSNNDKVRMKIDWGDGTSSPWTDYVESGTKIYKSHSYQNKGNYEIKVKVEDIDKMTSESMKSIKIGNGNSFHLFEILMENNELIKNNIL